MAFIVWLAELRLEPQKTQRRCGVGTMLRAIVGELSDESDPPGPTPRAYSRVGRLSTGIVSWPGLWVQHAEHYFEEAMVFDHAI